MNTRILRGVAFAIAAASVVDPALSVSGASRARVAVVVQPDASGAAAVRDRLQRDLSASYDLIPTVTSDAVAAILIGDRFPDDPLPDSLIVGTVTTPARLSPGVRIIRVDAPQEVPAGTAIHLSAELEGSRVAGQTTEVTVTVAGLETGRASHRWTTDAERWQTGIDVVPVGDPPYALRVAAASDAVADVVVDARTAPFRVEFYEPRPSWATTFLRRALEADARFDVASLGFASRGVAIQAGREVPLGDPRLDSFDVVIVGGLDRLSGADVGSLERFMRERGGAVVVIPDRRLDAGPARDLLSGVPLVERLLEQPATLAVTAPAAPLQASELLVVPALAPDAEIIARVPGGDRAPVIVSMPRGDGRLLISGAMDAWRFRAADHAAFDRFWQSAIAGLALAAPPPIAIRLEPPVLRPGEQGAVVVRLRSHSLAASAASIDGDQPIRLRPEPEAGLYRGTFAAKGEAGRSTIEVRTSGPQPLLASRTLLVRPDVQRIRPAPAPSLSMLAASHRGIDVTPEHLADVERFVRTAVASPRATVVRHPMRSTWWILPFAACLSVEWWIRRRRGLR